MKMLTTVKLDYGTVGVLKRKRFSWSLNDGKALEWLQSRLETSHMEDHLLRSKIWFEYIIYFTSGDMAVRHDSLRKLGFISFSIHNINN